MEKVLFLGAHPDDIDLGCAISMYDHYLKGDEITNIVLTKGEKGGVPSQRVIEQYRSFYILAPGATNYFLTYPDTALFICMQDIINKINNLVPEEGVDILYIPSLHDSHQDHTVAHRAAMAVFNNSSVRKILCYETPSTSPDFSPDYFKICDPGQIDIKLKALRCHQTQTDKAYFSDDTLLATARMRAAQARCHSAMAEAFEILRHVEYCTDCCLNKIS